MLGQVTITHLADTLEQLDQDTETLVSIGQGRGCQISTLKYQQEDGLNTVLPYGLQRVEAMRSLTTESTAVLMPFKAQEIQDKGGVYYGVNACLTTSLSATGPTFSMATALSWRFRLRQVHGGKAGADLPDARHRP